MLPTLAHHFSTDSLCAFLINSTDAVRVVVHSLSANMKLKIYETENFLSKRRADVLERCFVYSNESEFRMTVF